MEACKLRLAGSEDGNKHKNAQIGQDGHHFVLLDVLRVELVGGVGGVGDARQLLFKALLILILHNFIF